MPRHVRLLTVPLVLAVLALPASAKETKPRVYPEGKFGKGELRYVEGLPLLIVEGTPDEIGEQVGKLAVRHTGQLEKYLKDFLKDRRAERLWPILVKACDALVARMPESHRRELDAIAKGAGVDRDVAVVANSMMEVLKLAGCSTLVVEPSRSATGGLLFGRNFDFPALDMLNDLNVITVYRPRGKRAFVAVGYPGLIGHPTGMNDAGLCLAVNEIVTAGDGSPRFDPKGHPMMSTFRRVLEECSTVAEAEKLIRATPRTTMCSVTLCDPNSGVVLEVTSRSVVARPADRGVVACTNHFRSKELSTGEKCPRWEVFEKSFAKEKWTLAEVAKQMDAVNQGKYTLQTMIFEPAALKMQINFGKAPSSSEPLKPFDLKPLLRPTDR